MVMLTHVFLLHPWIISFRFRFDYSLNCSMQRAATLDPFFLCTFEVACNRRHTSGCSYFSHFVWVSYCAFGIFLIEICIFAGKMSVTEKRPTFMHFLGIFFFVTFTSCNTQWKVQLPINVHRVKRKKPKQWSGLQCKCAFVHFTAAISNFRTIFHGE